MQGVALLVALSALSVDQAWRPTEDGRVEYVLQIEPVFLAALTEGKEISGELPPEVERVDRICLRIGSRDLRTLTKPAPPWQELDDELTNLAAGTPPPDAPLAIYAKPNGDLYGSQDLTHGWQPISETETAYLIQLSPAIMKELAEGDEIYANVFSDAGNVRSFRITSGQARMPRKVARPPVMPVAQFQAQGAKGGRSSSPAADVPPTSDFTGGSSNSIYGDGDATNLGGVAAGDHGGARMLDPPTDSSAEVPQFDRSQFQFPKTAPGEGGNRSGRLAPTTRAGGSPPAARNSALPPDEIEYESPQESPRVASRTTTNPFPQRSDPAPSSATPQEEAKFPGWVSFLLVCALCASLGGNVYMIWTAAEYYSRYKLAIERLRSAGRG